MSKQAAISYRSILRRHMPEPLLALLIFVMGVWLWDNHFGPKYGWEESVGRMALRKVDRDLRLADGLGHFPKPVRALLAIPDRAEALERGLLSLGVLAADRALDDEGLFALGVLKSASGEEGSLPLPPDSREVLRRVGENRDSWWDREYLLRLGNPGSEEENSLTAIVRTGDPRSREVALRAILARGAVWLLVLCGLAFLPVVVRDYAKALRGRGTGYVGRWPAALGLGVFLIAYLASIGFAKALEASMQWTGKGGQPVAVPPGMFALLDAGSRFLPALLACAFLFRRGRHAWSRLGIGATPEWKLVLGSFALLVVLDQALRHVLGQDVTSDPAGGLSEMESGPWGLIFAITSACIAAPVAEEILFRGVLFRSLANGLRVPAATLLSAAVFAIVHFYDAYGLVSVGLLGASCALCFAASGRLATAIVLHALYNFAIKVPEWIVYHAPL